MTLRLSRHVFPHAGEIVTFADIHLPQPSLGGASVTTRQIRVACRLRINNVALRYRHLFSNAHQSDRIRRLYRNASDLMFAPDWCLKSQGGAHRFTGGDLIESFILVASGPQTHCDPVSISP